MTDELNNDDGLIEEMQAFEAWLRMKCFQKPTPEAYDLAKSAWQMALVRSNPLPENDNGAITEIIPDDLPEWMIKAMAEGQLFNTIIERDKQKGMNTRPLWSDSNDAIDLLSHYDDSGIVYNLLEDIKCLKESATHNDEWIECSHRLPDDTETVLCYEPNCDEDIFIYRIGDDVNGVITHWQRLPLPPKTNKRLK